MERLPVAEREFQVRESNHRTAGASEATMVYSATMISLIGVSLLSIALLRWYAAYAHLFCKAKSVAA